MALSFKLYTDFKKPNRSSVEKMVSFSAILCVLIIVLLYFKIIPDSFMIVAILIFFILPIIVFITMFSEEEHTKNHIGKLEINEEGIIIVDKMILWKDIENIQITYFDYKRRYLTSGTKYSNKLSSGVNNVISISQRGDNDFIGNFLIENKAETIKLKELLWNVVKTNKLTFDISKQLVGPSNYKEFQEVKSYSN